MKEVKGGKYDLIRAEAEFAKRGEKELIERERSEAYERLEHEYLRRLGARVADRGRVEAWYESAKRRSKRTAAKKKRAVDEKFETMFAVTEEQK